MKEIVKLNVYTNKNRSHMNENSVAGVLCGPSNPPVAVNLDREEVMDAFKTKGRLMELLVDKGKPARGCFRTVQFDEDGGDLRYVTLQRIAPGNEQHVAVPIVVVGKPKGYENGGRIRQLIKSVDVLGLARNLPKIVSVDVSSLKKGDSLRIKDLNLPDGAKFRPSEKEDVVLRCVQNKI